MNDEETTRAYLTADVIDDASCFCPACNKPVDYKWHRGRGFVFEPHNALVADCVYHAECWDKMTAEIPVPPSGDGTE